MIKKTSVCLVVLLVLLNACALKAVETGSDLIGAAERVAGRIVRENKADRNYRLDLAFEALLDFSAATGRPEYRKHVFSVLAKRDTKPDSPVPFRSQPFGCLTFALYRSTGDRGWLPVFLSETELCRRERPRSPEGAVMHPRGPERGGGDALLIDSMQEFAARMARAGAASGHADYFRESAAQFRLYRSLLRDPKTGLWSQGRGWLSAQPEALSPGAWSRGHGWLMRGLTAALAEWPRDSAEFTELQSLLRELADALLPLQQSDGMWHTLLHRPASESPADTSGTAMLATAFSKAWREGWLPEVRLRDAARRAFAALPAFVDADGVVLSVSPGPGPLEAEKDYLVPAFPPGNDHGPFSLLFAAAESVRLVNSDALSPALSRGMNLHHLLNWPDTKPGNGKTEYVWPPFETKEYQISDDELMRLKSMGFDYLRVTADPSIFLASEPARRAHVIAVARRTVARLIGAGFRVIFDLHPVSVNPDYAPLKLVESIDSPAFKAYADLMEEVARSLHDLPHERVAFELMNEPWLDSAKEIARWQPMLELLHTRARKGSPTLPLVLTGAQWGSPSALMKLNTKPFAGSNVMYTIHYYDPHTFTHQGVESDEGAYLAGLQWPASHPNTVAVLSAARARIDATKKPPAEQQQLKVMTQKLLNDYELTAHDAQRIRTDFEAVATWAAKNGIPAQRIFLGEFGCVNAPHKTPLGEDRAVWLRAVRDAAQAKGFGWALWAYKGYGGMALFDEAGKIDEGIVKGLELKRE